MHESALIRDLMARVELEAGDRRVAWVRLEIGALAGASREGVVLGVRHYAEEVWGYVPEVHARLRDEVSEPGALGVRLVSIGVET
jgi:hypothetical protein